MPKEYLTSLTGTPVSTVGIEGEDPSEALSKSTGFDLSSLSVATEGENEAPQLNSADLAEERVFKAFEKQRAPWAESDAPASAPVRLQVRTATTAAGVIRVDYARQLSAHFKTLKDIGNRPEGANAASDLRRTVTRINELAGYDMLEGSFRVIANCLAIALYKDHWSSLSGLQHDCIQRALAACISKSELTANEGNRILADLAKAGLGPLRMIEIDDEGE